MTMMQMYWLVMLDSIVSMAVIVALTAAGGIPCMGLVFLIARDDRDTHLCGVAKKAIAVLIAIMTISASIGMFIPTTKQAVAIWAVPKIINNEDMQDIANNVPEFINKLLQAWIDDLGEEVDE